LGTVGTASVLVSAALLMVGCRASTTPGRSAAPRPRLISLHDVTTDALVRLGAVDRLVGLGELVSVSPEVRAAVAGLPRVASAESIVALRPTAVVGLGVVADQSPELVDLLRRRGIDVYLAQPRTIADVYALVREVGRRAGVVADAEALVARTRERVDGLTSRATGHRVFVYDCCDPPFTAGGETVLSDLIARAGGKNIFADMSSGWSHVSWEQVVARRPELIVIDDYPTAEDQASSAPTSATLESKRAALRSIPTLARTPVVVMPLGLSLGGLMSVEALERLDLAITGIDG
jgi:iron complex transport system substrate-binding protein